MMLRHIVLPLCLFVGTSLAHAAPGKIGPFDLKSSDGDWRLTVGLAIQLRYQLDAVGLDQDDGSLDGFVEARRIRPTLRGTLGTKKLSYYLHLSTAPGSLEFMDFYLDYAFSPRLQTRVGQWKIPFTRFRTASFKDLTLVDWPITTLYFGAERQMGLALHNGYEKTPAGLQYEAGIFGGDNARASHAVGLPRLFGEKLENPSSLASPGPRATLHPELVAHLAYNLNRIDTDTDTDWEGGELRLSAGLSAAWDLDPDRHVDLALRLAPELLLKVRHLSFFSVFYLGFVRQGDGVADQRLGMLGVTFQTSYLFIQRLELALRYSMVHVDSRVAEDARSRAAPIIAAAADSDEAATLTRQYGKAGQVNREHEASLDLNVYFIGRSLKLQTDLSWLNHDLLARQQSDLRLRIQLQLAF